MKLDTLAFRDCVNVRMLALLQVITELFPFPIFAIIMSQKVHNKFGNEIMHHKLTSLMSSLIMIFWIISGYFRERFFLS